MKNFNKIIEQTRNHYDKIADKYVELFKDEIYYFLINGLLSLRQETLRYDLFDVFIILK